MSRLRLLLAFLALLVAGVALAAPAAAHDEDCLETKGDCEDATTTTEPKPTTTEKPKEPEPTTTTTAPETTTTTVEEHEDDATTSTTRRRRTTTTTTSTTAPATTAAPVFVGAGGSTSGSEPTRFARIGLDGTTFDGASTTAPSTSTSLDPLTYEPVELPTTTRPPVDRSDLETALASTEGSDAQDSTIFGISDTVIALALGALAVALLGTGGIRRWLDRS